MAWVPEFGQENLIDPGLDALIGQASRDQTPQRLMACGRTVIHQGRVRLCPGETAQALSQIVARHPAFGEPAAAGPKGAGPRDQRLSLHPERIDVFIDRRPDLGQGQGRQGGCDEEPRAGSRPDHPFCG
jgi:hypothetical protein